jgi:glycosyltransferase involved in cell wall biosynthesis
MSKLLTIGMATYDDFDGVYFSVQALLAYHEIAKSSDTEIIIIDNNPEGEHSKAITSLVNGWLRGKVKYIPFADKKSTATRNEIFKNASGKYCISMDCHVLFPPSALDSLISYYEANPNCKNLVQGPMLYDNHKGYATHFKPTWGGDMYGQWDKNEQAHDLGKPFEIPMMGLGVFSCETKNWLGFNPNFRGFGGEEGYIHEKFRDNGGKAICVPQFKWLHRFGRPNGVKYPLRLEDRIWNYFVGWLELKKDPDHPMIKEIYENFSQRIPKNSLDALLNAAIQITLGAENNANTITQ